MFNQLAKASIRYEKLRTLFILVTIVFATSLSLLNLLVWNSGEVQLKKQLEQMQHVIYEDLELWELEKLKLVPEFSEVVEVKQSYTQDFGTHSIGLIYRDENANGNIRMPEYSGVYPKEIYEIMIPREFQAILGTPIELGMELPLEFLDGSQETFVVSGILDSEIVGNHYVFYLSHAYALEGEQLSERLWQLLARLPETTSTNSYSFMEQIDTIGFQIGLEKYQINPNNRYVNSLSFDMNQFMLYSSISIAIFLVSSIVIYSIFYISILNRVKDFGQLRTIGASHKQLKRLVKREGDLLALLSIPLGILMGNIIGFLMNREGYELKSALMLSVGVGVLMWLTVRISVLVPAKLAGNVSPIEANKQSVVMGAKISHRKERNLQPRSLAFISGSIHKKKYVLTILSLGLTGVLFMVGATYSTSFDIEAYAREGELYFYDMFISLSEVEETGYDQGKNELKLDTPYPQTLLESIRELEGVEEIKNIYSIDVEYELEGLRLDSSVSPMSESVLNAIENKKKTTGISYEDLLQGQGMVVSYVDVYEEIYGIQIKEGDKILLRWFDGQIIREETFEVMLCLTATEVSPLFYEEEGHELAISPGWFFLPETVYKDMMIEGYDSTEILLVDMSIEAYLGIEELLGREAFSYTTYTITEAIEVATQIYGNVRMLLLIVITFLAVFCFVNLLNTLIMNVLTKKKELAIMQAVGMSRKQVRSYLRWEGLIFAIYTTGITGLLGGALGYAMVLLAHAQNLTYLNFRFPLEYFLGYCSAVIILVLLISWVLALELEKESLVTRLRK